MSKKALWTTMKGGLKPNGKPKQERRKRILGISKRMAWKRGVYLKQRKAFLKANPCCHACWAIMRQLSKEPDRKSLMLKLKWTAHPTTDIHHIRGRGKWMLDENYWVAVCRKAHDFIHDKPEIAREAGLLAKRGDWMK